VAFVGVGVGLDVSVPMWTGIGFSLGFVLGG